MAADLVETVSVVRPDVQSVDLLVGHSLGARVSLVCTIDHPSFAQRLVLEDPSGLESINHQLLAAEIRERIEAARSDPAALVKEWMETARSQPAGLRIDDDDLRATVDWAAATDPDYVSEVVERLPDIIPLVERCAVPILALLGRDERGWSMMLGHDRVRLSAALRHGELVELDGGHDLHRPLFDDFVVVLSGWLATHAGHSRDAGVRG